MTTIPDQLGRCFLQDMAPRNLAEFRLHRLVLPILSVARDTVGGGNDQNRRDWHGDEVR